MGELENISIGTYDVLDVYNSALPSAGVETSGFSSLFISFPK